MTSESARHLPRLKGLDGLRGLAIIAAVGYHLWPNAIPGGLVAVSLFFTLSGYLITSTLLWDKENGGVRLRTFWARRVRRLMPAAVVTLGAVLLAWLIAGIYTGDIKHDLVAAGGEFANWRQVVIGRRYGASPDASPLVHFWSLSIEEQFYIIFPILFVVFKTRRSLSAVLLAGIGVSLWATYAAHGSPVVVYYSTFVRAGEIFAGCLAAIWIWGRPMGRIWEKIADAVAILGVIGLTILAFSWTVFTPFVFKGGLLAIVPLSLAAVIGVSRGRHTGSLVNWGPLGWLGKRSYGMYLIHWPIFIGLRSAGITSAILPWITIAVTLVAGAAMYKYIETPIRTGSFHLPKPRTLSISVYATLMIAALVVPSVAGRPVVNMKQAIDIITAAANSDPSATTSSTLPKAADAIRYAWFGDSRAVSFNAAVLTYYDNPHMILETGWQRVGCPLGRGGTSQVGDLHDVGGDVYGTSCNWTGQWEPILAAQPHLDVAVVDFGLWDSGDRIIPKLSSDRLHFGDKKYDDYEYSEMKAATDTLLSSGVRNVVWLTTLADPNEHYQSEVAIWNSLLVKLGEEYPQVTIIDIASWLSSTGEAKRLLPDGIHTTYQPGGGTSVEVLNKWLAEQIIAAGHR